MERWRLKGCHRPTRRIVVALFAFSAAIEIERIFEKGSAICELISNA
jgi:hypothetical protein